MEYREAVRDNSVSQKGSCKGQFSFPKGKLILSSSLMASEKGTVTGPSKRELYEKGCQERSRDLWLKHSQTEAN
jgi:hypothetical protein